MSKKLHLEVLRIIAISMVVFNHVDGFFLYFSETDSLLTYLYSIIFSTLCRVAVPLFFMISGALLLGKKESLKELFQKRVIRMIAILSAFSLIYYLIDVVRTPGGEFRLAQYLQMLSTGKVTESFGFLYAYIGLLIMLPFLRYIAGGITKNMFFYLVILKIVFSVLVGLFTSLTGYGIAVNLAVLDSGVYYMLTGYCLEQFFGDNSPVGRKGSGLAIAFGLTVLCIGAVIGLEEWSKVSTGSYAAGILDLFVPVLVFIFWYGAKWVAGRLKNTGKKVVILLGKYTFCVYLTEKSARIVLLPVYLWLSENTFGVLACTVYVVGSLSLSYLLAAVIRKIPLVGKYI